MSIILPCPFVALVPVEYAERVLRLPVVALSRSKMQGDGGKLVRQVDGKCVLKVSKSIDLSSYEGRMVVWHEIGHYFDKAGYFKGRSNIDARATWGCHSTPARELLAKHADFIQAGGFPELWVRISGRTRLIAEWIADEELPQAVRNRLKMRDWRWRRKMRSYLKQDIELFAALFARWMACPLSVIAHSRELAQFMSDLTCAFGLHPMPAEANGTSLGN